MSAPRVLGLLACTLLAATPAHAQWTLRGGASVARAEHRVDAGFGVVTAAGTLVGVRVEATGIDDLVEVGVQAVGGRLGATDASVERIDRTMGELSLDASLLAMPWLALQGVATVRGFDMAPAVQRWTTIGAGAEMRMDFAGGDVRGLARMALLPRVTATGMPSPDYGVSSGAGLQATRGRLTAGVDYSLERYAFGTDAVGVSRHEQLSRLSLRLSGRW